MIMAGQTQLCPAFFMSRQKGLDIWSKPFCPYGLPDFAKRFFGACLHYENQAFSKPTLPKM
ncbi:MAG: hypothetical protein D6772_10655 [Bacteroidetes bacterium]|nr:MAG: hypothetical protein D6772_10655 [Bacteroidota bacterium]